MTDHVSTNVRLPREQWRALKMRAFEEGKSMGQVLRELLERSFAPQEASIKKSAVKKRGSKGRFSSMIGLGASGVSDGGARHDEALYGRPKSEWKS